MKIPNYTLLSETLALSLARIVSEDSQHDVAGTVSRVKSSKDS